jgi:hypothetical protein
MNKFFYLLFLSACLLWNQQAHAAIANVALNAKAFTSSPLYGGGNIAMLTDGNRQAVFHGDTGIPAGFSYTVDLGKVHDITSIKIHPRQDACCPERLSNFRVAVHLDDGNGAIGARVWSADQFTTGTNPGSAAGSLVTLTKDLNPTGNFSGRWIQITALSTPVPNYSLQMTELEVFAEAGNVSLNQAIGSAVFSNQPLYGGANIAMLTDGNRQASFHGNTDIPAGFAYEVNMGIPVVIDRIDIYARQDGCCPERLTNYRVSVHKDANGKLGEKVWSADLHTDGTDPGSTAGSKDTLTKDLNPAGKFEGQWIQILSLEDPVQNYALQMTEIEVYGTGPLLVSLSQQPQDLTSAPGRTATFRVGAVVKNGDDTKLTYQWQKNGVGIAGATQATYITPLLVSADAGAKFRCIVSYPGWPNLTSNEAAITRFNLALGALAFSNQPLWKPGGWNISRLTDGDRAGVFHGDVDIQPGFAYEVNLGTVVRIEEIVIFPRQDNCCAERLTNYRVSVHKDASGKIGDSVWSADRFTDGTNPGSKPGSLDSLKKDLNAAGQFEGQWIRILSLEDPVQNYALQMNELEVYGTLAPELKSLITEHPKDASGAPGKPLIFRVAANVFNGDLTKLTYQWQRNGVNIAGATEAAYTTPPLVTADEGAKLRCIVSYPGLPNLTSNEAVIGKLNWAFGAQAFSNSPLWLPGNWNISKLVDGDRQGVFHGHTDIAPGFAYEVNLGTVVKMNEIDIFARQDGCCPERLTNYRVSVHSDDNGKIGAQVWSADLRTDGTNSGDAPDKKEILTAGLNPQGKFEGQWIRILSLEDPVQNYALQMTELEVYGTGTIVIRPTINVTRSGNQIELSWTSGTLESADVLGGAWSAVTGATSPYKAAPAGGNKFYRLRQ